MAVIFVDGERITAMHWRPDETLTPEQRAAGFEVDEADLNAPDVASHQVARPYWRDGAVVWEIELRPLSPEEVALKSVKAAARVAVADKVKAEELDDDTVAELADIFDPWQIGEDVAVGDLRQWDGTVVECIQAHATQSDWTPDVVPALWKIHRASGSVSAWVQPQGAHDAYQTGEQVIHNDSTWESTVDDNSWEPGVYGWTQV